MGKLSVRLTREVFFRLTPEGECLFANAVLLCRNRAVEVEDVSFQLRRTSGSRKTYDLEALQFGTKVVSPDQVNAVHHFNSRSPREFLAPGSDKKALYLTALREYRSAIASRFRDLDGEVTKATALRENLPPQLDQAQVETVLGQVADTTRDLTTELMSQVQLEQGNYELTMTVHYRDVDGLRRVARSCSSTITFIVDDSFREDWQRASKTYVSGVLFSALRGESGRQPLLPEYQPKDIAEVL